MEPIIEVAERPTDVKGRVVPEAMTDVEMLTEMLIILRGIQDALEALSSNPMLSAFLPK